MHTVQHLMFWVSLPESCICSFERSVLSLIALGGILSWAREFMLCSESIFAAETLTSSLSPALSDKMDLLVVEAALLGRRPIILKSP